MFTRLILAIIVSRLCPAHGYGGWQGFQKKHFNTEEPWGYKPDVSYVGLLNSRVSYEAVSLMSPYALFGFDSSSSCRTSWREAWLEVTGGDCQANRWGFVSTKCNRDLFVILPCEQELLGLSPEQLALYARDFEDFLANESERMSTPIRNNIYTSIALEKVGKIYRAYHEKMAIDRRQLYIESVSQKIGAYFSEDLKELEARRRLTAAYKTFSEEFTGTIKHHEGQIQKWSLLRGVETQQEKDDILRMNSDLARAIKEESLDWESFKSNERVFLEAAKQLDSILIKWENFVEAMGGFENALASKLEAFRSAHIDEFWSSVDGDVKREDLLASNFKYLHKVQAIRNSALKRINEIRSFRKNYLSMFQAFQQESIKRIALHEKNPYSLSRQKIELAKTFSDQLLSTTSQVHLKPTKDEKLNLPYLFSRLEILKRIEEQRYLCEGVLEDWKQDSCELARAHFAEAAKDREAITSRYLKLYSKVLLKKAAELGVDGAELQRRLGLATEDDLESTLKVYDAILARVSEVSP